MIKHFYRTSQLILLLSLIVSVTDTHAQTSARVWGITQSNTGGSVFYMNSTILARSLTTDSISKVGMQPAFLMQARSGYIYGISSAKTKSDSNGVLFRINEKGASSICTLPFPLARSVKMVEGNDGYFYGVGQSPSGTNATTFKVRTDGTGFISKKISTYAFHARGGVMLTSSGKMLGMSESGGNNGQGFVFELLADLNIRIIYHFEKSGGKRPFGKLVESEGFLYGMTNSGGQYNYGAVFRLREDGQNFSTLHHFNLTNGAYPMGGLIIKDGFAYGLTTKGGSYKKGVAFRIKVDGTSYSIIHHFNGSQGEFPEGDLLIADGGNLTGAARGGAYGSGVLFSMKTDGTNFNVTHSFTQESPSAQLLSVKESFTPVIALTTPLSGSTNAGVQGTYRSRTELEARSYTLELTEDPQFRAGIRTITSVTPEYKLGTSNLKFSTSYYARVRGNVWPVFGPVTSFKTRSAADYAYVTQPLDQSMAVTPNEFKLVVNSVPGAKRYKIQVCHVQDFSSAVISDSSRSDGDRSFTISGLSYGKKYYAHVKSDLSSYGKTTVFTTAQEPAVAISLPHGDGLQDPSMVGIECSVVPGAQKYTIQISSSSDFSSPLTRSSVSPGQNSFAIRNLQPDTHYYLRAQSDMSSAYGPVLELNTRPAVAQKRLWGLTTRGGNFNLGTIFSFSIDSNAFTRHHDYYNASEYIALTGSLTQTPAGFAGLSVADGTGGGEVFNFSHAGLTLLEDYGPHQGSVTLGSDNYLYIVDDWINLFRGGVYKIFSAGDDESVFDRIIFRFGTDDQGINPTARLLEHNDGYLYGCTPAEGQFDKGTLFRIKMDGSAFEVIHHFNNTDGAGANTGLIAGTDDYLYGVTAGGGTYSHGVIYKIRPDGAGYKVIHHFNGSTGSRPEAALTLLNGKLYGTTSLGGTLGQGVVFSVKTDGTMFTKLLNCDGVAAGSPRGELTIDGSTIYGMTSAGGANNMGVIFKMHVDGTSFQPLFAFTPESGGAPDGGLLLMEDTFFPPGRAATLTMNNMEDSRVRIYPNPFSDTFTAEVSAGNASFMLRDMNGAVRLSFSEVGVAEQMGAQLEKGIYILTVHEGDKTSNYRLVKN